MPPHWRQSNAADTIQIVDREKEPQLMRKECLAAGEEDIYRTLLIKNIHKEIPNGIEPLAKFSQPSDLCGGDSQL
jgi:hypothetical protein